MKNTDPAPEEKSPEPVWEEPEGFEPDLSGFDVPDFDCMVFGSEGEPAPDENAGEPAAEEPKPAPAPPKMRYGVPLLDPISDRPDAEPEEWPYPEEEDWAEEEPDIPPREWNIKPDPGDVPYVPYESVFRNLFGEDRFYAVATIAAGAYALIWSVMYLVLLIDRAVMIKSAETAIATQGQLGVTFIYTSPLTVVLQIMLYALPTVLIVWTISVVHADRSGLGYGNKKTAVVVLALLGLLGVLALVDLGFFALIFTSAGK